LTYEVPAQIGVVRRRLESMLLGDGHPESMRWQRNAAERVILWSRLSGRVYDSRFALRNRVTRFGQAGAYEGLHRVTFKGTLSATPTGCKLDGSLTRSVPGALFDLVWLSLFLLYGSKVLQALVTRSWQPFGGQVVFFLFILAFLFGYVLFARQAVRWDTQKLVHNLDSGLGVTVRTPQDL
jgi:hypothetical protein